MSLSAPRLLRCSWGKSARSIRSTLVVLIVVLAFGASCSIEHKVDSYEKWAAEQLSRLDGKREEHFVSSIDRNKIREGFVRKLNDAHMKEAQGKADRMVWMEGKNLHMHNMSNFLETEANTMIDAFRDGIRRYSDNTFYKDAKKYRHEIILYGAVFTFFDSVAIHSLQSNSVGAKPAEYTTTIETGRREYLKKAGRAVEKITKEDDF